MFPKFASAGIKIFATGGIGGVHRGASDTFDAKIGLRGDANMNHKADIRDAAKIAEDLAKIAILNNLSSIDKEIEVEECYIDIMDEIERNRSVTAKQAVSLVGRSGLLCRTRDGAQKKKFKVL